MRKHGQVTCKCTMNFVVRCRKYLTENGTYDDESGEMWVIMKTRSGRYQIVDNKSYCFEIVRFDDANAVTIYRYNY